MPNFPDLDWNNPIKLLKVRQRLTKVKDFSLPLPLTPSPPLSDSGGKAVLDFMPIGARHIPRRHSHQVTSLPGLEAHAEGATA